MKHTILLAGGGAALLAAMLLSGCMTKSMVGNDPTVEGTVQVCSSCHGLEGRSQNPTFPNLAGQQKDYIVTQLKALRAKTRGNPHAHTYMWGMAAKLTDAQISGVAAYYAAQTPARAEVADTALVAAGREIYRNGIAARNVPACQVCHGEDGMGNSEIPRLADQHAVYLVRQIHDFRGNLRASEIMHANVEHLTDPEAQEVAAYLSSL